MVRSSIILKKISHIRHNLARLREKQGISINTLREDLDIQDVVLHNLQLAVQGCVDIGSHIISDEGWGIAGSLNEIFYILQDKGAIKAELADKMVAMVGFRNILVHEYQDVDLDIVHNILRIHLKDIDEYLIAILDHFKLG